MRIQFVAFNRTFNLHLEPNLDLFHPEATITIYHADQTSTTTPLIHDDYRLYKGVVLDSEETDKRLDEDIIGLKRRSLSEEIENSVGVLGWARIQVLDDGGTNKRQPTFEGTFSFLNDLYHIKTIKNFKTSQYFDDPEIPNISARSQNDREATMVIYRDSDTKKTNIMKRSASTVGESCGMDDLISDEYRRRWKRGYLRDENFAGVEDPYFHHNPSTYVRGLFHSFGGSSSLSKRATTTGCPTGQKIAYMVVQSYTSSDLARKQILNDWSTASAVYERTFNITLGLINILIQDQSCPTTINTTMAWNRPCSGDYTIDDRLSDFSEWRGKLGTSGQAYVSGTAVSTVNKDEWKVIAHEIGHGFGAIHDCTASTCPCTPSSCICCPLNSKTCDANGQYIMNPTSDVATNNFRYTLRIRGTDCANDPCCNGPTCKFKNAIKTTCVVKIVPTNQPTPFAVLRVPLAISPNTAMARQAIVHPIRMYQMVQLVAMLAVLHVRAVNVLQGTSNMSANFIDGTPCGFGGKCAQGTCQTGSLTDTVSSWLNQNKQYVIPVGIVLGNIPPAYPSSTHNANAWVDVTPYNGPNNHDSNWVDPTLYNGSSQPYRTRSPPSHSSHGQTPYLPDQYYAGVSSPGDSPGMVSKIQEVTSRKLKICLLTGALSSFVIAEIHFALACNHNVR
ncbi:1368_t:CDS:10 [Acaulospora colombiana]|uniref:1368_t:CDS:1 n=1 Tax=Acaulospora colombiana TaxID=27376 RepID=A0ACA9K7U0_9GLOM|nr:1368_t:CDS:10 [Acaulospora colombiana]